MCRVSTLSPLTATQLARSRSESVDTRGDLCLCYMGRNMSPSCAVRLKEKSSNSSKSNGSLAKKEPAAVTLPSAEMPPPSEKCQMPRRQLLQRTANGRRASAIFKDVTGGRSGGLVYWHLRRCNKTHNKPGNKMPACAEQLSCHCL